MTVLNMDCVKGMRGFPDNSFDSIVCDPPYELTGARPGGRSPATEGKVMKGFMGMTWDGSGIAYSVEMWAEALRVLKPGGHMFAFGGTRTYHRMVCAIEDAGFEIRDQFGWVYGSGFPKSRDISKLDMDGQDTEDWDGWGTAVKPAWEPICLARKPLAKGLTVAANVLAYGTGALNIEACRVGTDPAGWGGGAAGGNTWNETNCGLAKAGAARPVIGRWPANIIHDGSDEVIALFPDTGRSKVIADSAQPYVPNEKNSVFGAGMGGGFHAGFPDTSDSAARFFYCAKASKADRDDGLADFDIVTAGETSGRNDGSLGSVTMRANIHPTVKPNALMRHLVRLITPRGGTVLDHFSGSGSTGKAAKQEGFGFIGFEQDAGYARIANARIDAAQISIDEAVNSG